MKRTPDVTVAISSYTHGLVEFDMVTPSNMPIDKMPLEELYKLYHMSVKFQEHIVDKISEKLKLE